MNDSLINMTLQKIRKTLAGEKIRASGGGTLVPSLRRLNRLNNNSAMKALLLRRLNRAASTALKPLLTPLVSRW
jgi:hypothetical protein